MKARWLVALLGYARLLDLGSGLIDVTIGTGFETLHCLEDGAIADMWLRALKAPVADVRERELQNCLPRNEWTEVERQVRSKKL